MAAALAKKDDRSRSRKNGKGACGGRAHRASSASSSTEPSSMRGGGGDQEGRATVGSRLMEEHHNAERIKRLLERLRALRDARVRADAHEYQNKVEAHRAAIETHSRKLIQARNAMSAKPSPSALYLKKLDLMIRAARMKLAEWMTVRIETQKFIKSVHHDALLHPR